MYLIQFVDRGADRPEHVTRDAAHLEDAVEDLPVVHLHHELAHFQRSEDLLDDLDALRVRDHGVVGAGNVEILEGKIIEPFLPLFPESRHATW